MAELDPVEQWFVRRGIPHFIADYSARTDIWTRALPALVIGYAAGGLNALDLKRSLVWNLGAFATVAVILLATWAITNRLRGRRAMARPREIGPPELVVYVVGPAVPSMVLGQGGDAVQTVLEGLATLAAIYLYTSYGVGPLVRWAAGRVRSQFVLFFNVVVRVLPLLLLAITFLFVNAEVWQVAGTLYGWPYWAALGLFFLLGVVFVLSRIPVLVEQLSCFESWAEIEALAADTPAAGLATTLDHADATLAHHQQPAPPALRRRERFNVGLVSVFSQAIQVTLVAAMIFVFFVLFGALTINRTTAATWMQVDSVHVLVSATGGRLLVTEPLLRVAGFLAAFTGMYFTVVLSTDSTYREEFAEDVAPQVRQAFAVRAVYRQWHQPPTR